MNCWEVRLSHRNILLKMESMSFWWLMHSWIKLLSCRKLGFSVANEPLRRSPKPLKAKLSNFIEKQKTKHSNFVNHSNIFHNIAWNLHHYAKNKLSEWTYWKLIYLGDNIWLLLRDGNLPVRSQEPQTKMPFLKK